LVEIKSYAPDTRYVRKNSFLGVALRKQESL